MEKIIFDIIRWVKTGQENKKFQIILDYPEFIVIGEIISGRYFYFDRTEDEEDPSNYAELKCVAMLCYDVKHDVIINNEETSGFMHGLFDCDVCGETVVDDQIEYLWFKRV